jgi:murein peptide amidase A
MVAELALASVLAAAPAPVRVLVSGSIHGTEPAGYAVIARLRRLAPPHGVQVWTVRSFNPDGATRGTRQNARGVDLNRNVTSRSRGGGRPFDTYYPGPRAASEPETRVFMRLVRRIRPDLSIHFHQALRLVNLTGGPDPALVRAYARRAEGQLHDERAGALVPTVLPAGRGAAQRRQPARGQPGPLSPPRVQRHARAVLGVAALLLPRPARATLRPPLSGEETMPRVREPVIVRGAATRPCSRSRRPRVRAGRGSCR